MSGYRQSNYDPHAGSVGGPLRPFNWVQWSGVAMLGLGIVLLVAMIAGDLGVAWLHGFSAAPAIIPILTGNLLISSRRQAYVDPAPELAAARRKWMIVVGGGCALILGVAAIFALKGY